MCELLTLWKCFMSLAVFIATILFWTYLAQAVDNILGCYVKFRRTHQSCSASKISQSVNTRVFMGKPFLTWASIFLT